MSRREFEAVDGRKWGGHLVRKAIKCGALAVALVGGGLSVATSASAAPAFTTSITDQVEPFRVGDRGSAIVATVRNVGPDPATDPTTVRVEMPPGVSLRSLSTGTLGFVCDPGTAECVRSTGWPVNQAVEFTARVSIDSSAAPDARFTVRTTGGGALATATDHDIQIEPFRPFGVHDFTAGAFDDLGADYTQAGGEPYTASTTFFFNRNTATNGENRPVEDVRRIITELPPGFIGNPQAVTECTEAQMTNFLCPPESQVGIADVDIRNTEQPGTAPGRASVYRIKPQPGYAAEFGFSIVGVGTVYLFATVRSDSDYGIDITVPSSPSVPQIQSASVTLWGRPADPRHDALRCANHSFFCLPTPSTAPPKRFLANPAQCTGQSPITVLNIDSWQNPGIFRRFEAAAPPVTGCDRLTFEPDVDIAPTTTLPDAPTGLNVDMRFPTEDNDEGLAPPPLKKAVVTMPEGMTINPSGAGGLDACTDAQLNLKTKDPVTCPDAAKVGSVTATSPLMEETLSGGVYIRSQNSNDPESGEMFRIALVLENAERGLSIRLPGQIRINKQTGRIETTFDNNPQLPVENLNLKFKDGPRAPLATPAVCGPKTIDTVLTSWGGQTKTLQSSFNVDCVPHLGTFDLGFQAGTHSPVAGASSPFNLLLTRADGKDVINGLRLAMPEGLLANLNGNVGTQIGSVTADAGPGSQPYRFPGKVYLEGPYDDAPFSLRVVIPAKAGPFDLGEVVVRQKIYVDPITAAVTVVSDPIPTIVEGVPVRLRNMSVDIDKPGFMINPTSCAEKEVNALATSLSGQNANLKTRFQVGGCENLPVKPQMKIDIVGSKQLSYHKHPGVKATVTQTPGEAGLKRVEVAMPLSLALDTKNAKALCEAAEAKAKACPEASVVGDATAISPVLNRPLKGKVYFVKGTEVTKSGIVKATLPKLWVALRGEVALDVWADSTVKARRLVSTFARVPDAPISSFELNIHGGENGILGVTGQPGAHMCNQVNVADAQFTGQNGKRFRSATTMVAPCRFGVVSSVLGASSASVRVTGLGTGRLTASGPGVRTTRRSVRETQLATVRAPLSAAGLRAYRAGKSVRVKVTFKPSKGKAKTKTVVVKRATKKATARGGSTR